MIREALQKILSKLTGTGEAAEAAPVFNIQAVPGSVADGITLDKLGRICASAEAGNADELFRLYSSICSTDTTFIAGALQRKAKQIAENTTASAPQKSPPEMIERRDFIRRQWRRAKGKRQFLSHLLDASAWPVAFARMVWGEAPAGSGHYYNLARLEPVPFWQVTFQADGNGPAGIPKIKKLRPDGTWTGETELPDPLKYVSHRGHLLQANPDCWGGPMRAVVYSWYFAAWARQAAANHLEGEIQPKWIAKYGRVDQERSRKELLRAFSREVTTRALIIPEDTKIEAVATLKGEAADSILAFIQLCQKEIAKVIVGQTLTLVAQSQGMGSNQSDVQGQALDDIQGLDRALLAETVEEQVFGAILALNGRASDDLPSLVWGSDAEETTFQADALEKLYRGGIRVKAAGVEGPLSDQFGLPLELIQPSPASPAAFAAPDKFERQAARRGEYENLLALSTASDTLAERTASDLAAAYGVDFAPLSRALRDATGPKDLLARLRPAVAALSADSAAALLEDALAAGAANGLFAAANP